MAADGGTVAAVCITIMAGGLLVTGAGMIMLAQGNPTGGHPRRGGQRRLRAHRSDLPDRLPVVPGQAPQ